MKPNLSSPFKPKSIKDYRPQDLKIYTLRAGFKKKNKDLLVIVFDKVIPVAIAYSQTSMPSAPIIWDKKNNNNFCKALIVNSGNANAHTGTRGINQIEKYTKVASKIFQCKKSEILVSSTGVIGEELDSTKIIKKLNCISKTSLTSINSAAKAIMTTDTFPKIEVVRFRYKLNQITIYGFAKGSGMIAPNMGTMLAYIFIEAPLKRTELKRMLKKYIDSTFNSISVDGDTSTSDTIILFSTGLKKPKIKMSNTLLKKISKNVHDIMLNLSKQIVSDGEGISKLIEVTVSNAKNKIQASKVAFSIAESNLVKTAIAGEDANWGRIVMAIGKADKHIDQNKVIIKFDNLVVAKKGAMYKKIDLTKLNRYMKNKVIKIKVNLGIDKYTKKVWSSDLTHEYININSDYRS
jgi:glutamate N-acetyltransferase/amino-acid N-acetyltransferase|tara:strand:- start:1215 stop:2432 length:1218 start_codon:yes stop_codon:yes gene_type:complete